jgi:Protein of unknown function (DUF3224)
MGPVSSTSSGTCQVKLATSRPLAGRPAPEVYRVPPMSTTATGTFDISLGPGPAELDGAVSRFEFTKTFNGDLEGTSAGILLSAGDPKGGSAGYVAVETVSGKLGDREGRFVFQQFGTMLAGTQTLHYEVVPGSGEGDLSGITGRLRLTIDDDGTHHYELEYDVAASE